MDIGAFIWRWSPRSRREWARRPYEVRDDWHSTQKAADAVREGPFRYRVTAYKRLGAGLVPERTWHKRFFFTACRKADRVARH